MIALLGFAGFLALGPAAGQDVGGGMLDPAMDPPGEPFCYFANPTDVIGAWLAPVASEITPEGYTRSQPPQPYQSSDAPTELRESC